MNDFLYLVIDQGGQSSRVLVFDASGQQRLILRESVQTKHPMPGRVEQEPLEVVASIRTLLDKLPEQLGADLYKLKSVAIVTQRSSLVCWDRQTGGPLSPVLSWQDIRAAGYLKTLALSDTEIAEHTGLRPNAHYGASKMRWCLDTIPGVKAALGEQRLACGPLASFLLFSLTREHHFAVDPGNAQRTLLWHLPSGRWDEVLLAQFDIPKTILPPLQPSASNFGDLQIGDVSLPVELLNGDQNAAFFCRGTMPAGQVTINAGTGAFIAVPCPQSAVAPEGLLKTLIFETGTDTATARCFVVEGTVNGAASALELQAAELGVTDYQRKLEQWCRSETKIPLFLNGVGGLGAPYWQGDFQSRFVDVDTKNNAAAMVAVLESIVFLLMVNLLRIRDGWKESEPLTGIQVGGGLSQLDGFCQRLADLARLPVLRGVETEATGRGAAFLLAGRPEVWPAQPGDEFAPMTNAELSGRFQHWLKAMAEATATVL
ncbi:MAG: glycerol kinase [Gammaproteobacteria bacterium]|nr:MAG: glycerol kinase [Gammaproteobacteria bacterium]